MADFKDKFTGKQYKISTFEALKSALAGDPDNKIDGRRHEELEGKKAIANLPYRIKQGDQAKFFPGLKEGKSDGLIETGSDTHPIRDVERGIVYVPIKKKNYQKNLIGVGSHISSTFAPSAYLQVSAAFARKFSGVGGDTLITFCVEESYTPSGSFAASRATLAVGPMTASYDIKDKYDLLGGSQFSAMHITSSNSGSHPRDFAFTFPEENFITHWSVRFASAQPGGVFDYSSSIYVETASFRFNGDSDTGNTSSIVLDDIFLASSPGGTTGSIGTVRLINPKSVDDGTYTEYIHKTRLAGDGDSGSAYTAFPGQAQIIIYPPKTENNRGSRTFQYHPTSRAAATGSSTFKTLHFYSGSGAGSQAHPDYGFFVSRSGIGISSGLDQVPRVGSNMHGASLHPTTKLRRNADIGFYSPSGSQYSSSIYVQTASGLTTGLGPVWGYLYEDGN